MQSEITFGSLTPAIAGLALPHNIMHNARSRVVDSLFPIQVEN